MDEAEARRRLDVSRETLERLDAFVALLREENERQNLVSKASLDHLWERHILDSAQLVRWAPDGARTWIDLGTGAGFPGLVVALLFDGETTLVEARRLRTDFLRRAAELLGIPEKVTILGAKVETVPARPFDVISARAFAPLQRLMELGSRFSTEETEWILPKGRNAKSELEAARASWQGELRIEPSLTDDEAGIIVGRGVRRKAKGKRAR
ncbi:MAG: 16S rRNA (guanine(527)-N(7))-methyltransferase RsmG [Alphaproteobacteria bacterium]|nr:16S rRNA (guanine(527)-N(7))-methyltransferase RsmG [Alphaproteobacteria bacterium]MBV9372258.1 16S rRNA (guanine(527)-N(7))-methyltransferase RsmG [Alphaproteobacteria bacterium]MBV9901631.1 16S rRNA (guanine(527)-N(7))-methyltransferase RsmG [Alphaproteobacteria bacterium]